MVHFSDAGEKVHQQWESKGSITPCSKVLINWQTNEQLYRVFQTGIHSVWSYYYLNGKKKRNTINTSVTIKDQRDMHRVVYNLNFTQTGTELNRTEPNFWLGQRKKNSSIPELFAWWRLLLVKCIIQSMGLFKQNSNSQNGENRCSVWHKKSRFPYLHRILKQVPDNGL